MFKRLLNWISKAREWNQEHHDAWKLARIPGPDGFSPFQKECERRLNAALAEIESEVTDRTIEGTTDHYISGKLGGTEFEFWIYTDGVQISGPRLDYIAEHWDARTPEELYVQFTRKAIEVVNPGDHH